MKKVVLFDFHNTLVTCDGWLELEIKALPGLVIKKLASRGLVRNHVPELVDRATALFLDLRQGVRESGREISAVDGTKEVFRQMDLHMPEGEVERAVGEIERALLPQVQALPGTGHALEKLRDAGYRLGVVSSAGYPPFIELSLEELGLRPYFSEVVTSAAEGIYKSSPEIFLRAVHRLGAEPSQAIHVGDHPLFDVRAARDAGLSTIWLAEHTKRTAEIRGEPFDEQAMSGRDADAVIYDMADLFDAVKSLG